jgi:5-methylcytosine-specific restriction endonuclease McrA
MPIRPPFFRPRFQAPRADEVRGSSYERGYDNVWRRFRSWFLSNNPLCAFRDHPTARTDCTVAANTVDHVRPLSQGGERLDPDNCRAVCPSCHAKLTANLKATGRNEMPAGATR